MVELTEENPEQWKTSNYLKLENKFKEKVVKIMFLKSFISVIIICLVFIPSFLSAAGQWKHEYIIKPEGIYIYDRTSNTFTPFILLGETRQNVFDKMGRSADKYGASTNTFAYVSKEDITSDTMEPAGLIFYTFTYIIPPELEYGTKLMTSAGLPNNANPTIESIGIYDSRFRTVKGTGVGTTVTELYAAHGKTTIEWHYYNGIGWCLEYPAQKGRIFFSIGQVYIDIGTAQLQNGLADNCTVCAIYLTGTKCVLRQ
ncbi:MAG: hypothetical protein ABRQ39_17690 [Candidatus Eremiobacterota bacterium]